MGAIGLERSIRLVGLDRSKQALLEGYARLAGNTPIPFEPAEELSEVEPQEAATSDVMR